jgi:hypothetical protein
MEQKTRDYFSFFLSVYCFALALGVQFVVLPPSGRPTAVHLMLSLLFSVFGVFFCLRGQRVIVLVWGKPK